MGLASRRGDGTQTISALENGERNSSTARLASNSANIWIYWPTRHEERRAMPILDPSAKWPPDQHASRNSGRGFLRNWAYLEVAAMVTLLVVWSLLGPFIASQTPPTCACVYIVPRQNSLLPILAGFGLFLFYLVLFFVKFAREREDDRRTPDAARSRSHSRRLCLTEPSLPCIPATGHLG